MENLIRKTGAFAAIVAIVYVLLFSFVDKPTVLWIHDNCSQTWLPLAGKYISVLASGSYIRLALALCFILILIFDSGLERRETRVLLYICICGAIGIVIEEGLKYLLGRYRPIMLFQYGLYGLHGFASKWELTSSPSGHAVRAFSILTGLSLLYRRFTILFISLAVLISLSRVAVTDHYPSDIVFGAYIGIFTSLWTYVHFFPQDKEFSQ